MFAWFKENLPIKRKLQLSFHLQLIFMVLIIAVPFGLGTTLSQGGILGVEIGIAAVAAGLAFIMRAAMGNPYVTTVVRMEALAAGDLTSPIQFTAYRDCVGRMTKAMHIFQEAALTRVVSDREAEELRIDAAAERTRLDTERAGLAQQQQAVVNSLAHGLSQLADGNLTCHLDQSLAPEYERLRLDFNRTLEQLRTTMNAVMFNADTIRSGTKEIARTSDDLSRRTEQQAASLEETAAALGEITTTVRRTADGSVRAQAAVLATKEDAAHSRDIVRDAVAAMGKIDESSRQIGRVIGVIDEMAFQTNLLALNAGVEAARAGEAGRGFAVVASEVRALAQRSAEASKEIKALVSTSDGQVKSGVELVGEAGRALSRIIKQVDEINTAISDIAGSANEQAAALAQVNTAVNQMDQVTQQNAAMVEEATAAAHSLTQETEDLGVLISRFQIGQPVDRQQAKSTNKNEAGRRSALKVVSARNGSAVTAARDRAGA